MSQITKIFGKQDFQNNDLVNVKVENITTSNVALRSYVNGSIYYNSNLNEYYGVRDNVARVINTGNNYSRFLVQSSDGDTWVNSTSVHDSFTFNEGTNISFDVNTVTRKITINSEAIAFSNNFAQTFGDASNTAYLIDHNLNSTNVIVQIQETTANGNIVPWSSNVAIVNGNQILVRTPSAPGANAYKAVISSNMGPQGFQGVTGPAGVAGGAGATGPQGPQGSFGDNIPGEEYQTTRLDASNTVVSTNVIRTHDKGTSSNVTITANNDSYALIVKGGNLTAAANVGGLYSEIEYNYTNFDSANSRILSGHTKGSNTAVTEERFYVDGDARIKSKHLTTNTTGSTSQRLTYADNDGIIHDSDIELETFNKICKVTKTFDSTLILLGTPLELVASPGTGKIIVPHHFLMKFTHISGQFTFPGSVGIVIDSTNTNAPIFSLDTVLLSGTVTGYQAGDAKFVDDATHTYIADNKGLYFKSLGGTPGKIGTNPGEITITVYYSVLDT